VRSRGLTLIELMAAMSASLIVVLIVGSLLESGHKSWARAFDYANSEPQIQALETTISFGTFGRKSNKVDYKLYEISSGHFGPVLPPDDPEDVVTGQAVEFHFWDVELGASIMDVSITGTAYALYYLDGDKLMLDIGPYPPGGVDSAGDRIDGPSVTTVILAENVTNLEFSHTTRNLSGDGRGCIRLNMTITNPVDGEQTTVTAATLMRNVWP